MEAPSGYTKTQSIGGEDESLIHLWVNESGCWIAEHETKVARGKSTAGGCRHVSMLNFAIGSAFGVLIGVLLAQLEAAKVRVHVEGTLVGIFDISRKAFLIPLRMVPDSAMELMIQPLGADEVAIGEPIATDVKH
ncbi:hypothetical protein [Salinispora arenicola]|uniref:hypothetical protein n=1 Tax=Salinispora arenicola TaxID=168697 RepID=UPI0012BCA853|nr:hypothetical protein [Salinispora arenicola]